MVIDIRRNSLISPNKFEKVSKMYNIIAIISQLNQPEYKVESIIAEYLKTLTFLRHHIEILFSQTFRKNHSHV